MVLVNYDGRKYLRSIILIDYFGSEPNKEI